MTSKEAGVNERRFEIRTTRSPNEWSHWCRAKSADAQLAAASAALQQAALNLGYTKIVAPTDGIVGRPTAQTGQNVEPGQELLTWP